MAEKQSLLTPTGRLIWGDPYEPETKDMQGRPLTVKNGPNAGQARQQWAIGIAIPKTKAAWWEETSTVNGQPYPWGQILLTEGQKSFPNGAWQREDFAWKIIDGDSTKFNQATPPKRFCDIPNYKGHWVIKFASGFAPKIVNENGTAELTQPGHVYPGCYVQVFGTIEGNRNDQKPGMYMNLQIVSFQAHGERITVGPAADSVGFGGGALPIGASATPIGGMGVAQAQQTAMGMPGAPVAPPAGVPQLPGAAPAPQQVAVAPNPGFVTLPGVPGAPPAVPTIPQVPVAVVQHVMTAKAGGVTYEAFIANSWTDELLRAQGYMV